MVAARTGRDIFGRIDFDHAMSVMDWNRVAIEATGRHLREHADSPLPMCGPCLRATVLANEETPSLTDYLDELHAKRDSGSHTRTSTTAPDAGPDYCAECSERTQDWVPWPCENGRTEPDRG